jgi:2-polyprenyl-3-methyl-5-hydroxy-6-metoxy-1,4-benzoquinol methylase
MKCIICESKNFIQISDKTPGYVDGTSYKIFYCKDCDGQFIDTSTLNPKIYDEIYSQEVPGYDVYQKIASKIISAKKPLNYLKRRESGYYGAIKVVKKVKPQRILEIGCGMGYLTYAFNKEGYDCTGLDISATAIEYAQINFGKHYFNTTIEEYSKNSKIKYDIIIGTEVIEHLPKVKPFLDSCKKLLAKNGKIIISTPEKKIKTNQIWKTEAPPIHTSWLSRKSFERISKDNKLECKFVNFNFIPEQNQLAAFLISKISSKKARIKNNQVTNSKTPPIRKFIRKIIDSLPVVYISNLIYNLFFKFKYSLCAVLYRVKMDKK